MGCPPLELSPEPQALAGPRDVCPPPPPPAPSLWIDASIIVVFGPQFFQELEETGNKGCGQQGPWVNIVAVVIIIIAIPLIYFIYI